MPERTQIGHECFRLAIQLMIIRQVFKYAAEHPRVRLLSTQMIDWLEKCRESSHTFGGHSLSTMNDMTDTAGPTTEIGLLFPLIVSHRLSMLSAVRTHTDSRSVGVRLISRCMSDTALSVSDACGRDLWDRKPVRQSLRMPGRRERRGWTNLGEVCSRRREALC